jgi:AAA domain, putative AbiEii toxin, Type IV TA system
MIYVDRKQVASPDILASAPLRRERRVLERFFSRPRSARFQERVEIDDKRIPELLDSLEYLFHKKCAYCESYLGPDLPLEVDRFRPPREVTGLTKWTKGRPVETLGGRMPDGYWWLAYEWENLYLACSECCSSKLTQFPILGHRSKPHSTGRALLLEDPLLVDPCFDNPHLYLRFRSDGLVEGRTVVLDPQARWLDGSIGPTTIDVLTLNRPTLVRARKEAAGRTEAHWSDVLAAAEQNGGLSNVLEEVLDRDKSFLALRQQVVAQRLAASRKVLNAKALAAIERAFLALAPGIEPDLELAKSRPPLRGRTSPPRLRAKSSDKSRASGLASAKIRRPVYLRRVEIRNYRTIRSLDFDLSPLRDGRAAWKVLLGENGTGKTSVLQAIALGFAAAAGKPPVEHWPVRPSYCLRVLANGSRAKSGCIRLHLSTEDEPITLTFDDRAFCLESRTLPNLPVVAYGPNRAAPRNESARRAARRATSHLASLFDPYAPSCDVETWLCTLTNGPVFGALALTLKDLLCLPSPARFRSEEEGLCVSLHGLRHSIRDLSAGYESLVVMAVDIARRALPATRDLRYAPGIVLVDEIDQHLHPRWNLRVVESLRRAFPLMQFIVTTHEPLCLRGARDKEILVLERTGRDIEAFSDLPSPRGMRIDRLLTSPFFGLHSTLDLATQDKFERYYALLSKLPGNLSDSDRHCIAELRGQLADVETKLLANTPRETLFYEVMDEYLAKDANLRGDARAQLPKLREGVKESIQKVLTALDVPDLGER